MSNPYETLARRIKAERMAHALFDGKVTAAQAKEYFGQAQWNKLAKIAGVSEPSAETCEMVLELLKAKERECHQLQPR